MTLRSIFIAVAFISISGCEKDTAELECLVQTPGIALSVVDSINGSPYAGPAVIVAKDGPFLDSVNVPVTAHPTPLARDRAGFYSISVKTPDHFQWTAANVLVTSNGCNVNTVNLTARMRRDTASSTFAADYIGRGEFADPTLVRVEFRKGAFQLAIAAPDLLKQEFLIPTFGTATARFSLVSATGDTLGSTQVAFEPARNVRYGITGYVHSVRPTGACVGPITLVPLRRLNGQAAADSLFVMFLGLTRGAIC